MWVYMLLPLLFLAAIVWWIIGVFKPTGKISSTGSMICPICGTRGEPKQITKGSTGIELLLWLCFLLPGLIYSIWRLSSRQQGCPSCGHISMISIATPRGQQLLKQ